jgi:hypothetical protein
MSSIEWISPYVAVPRLESLWNILSLDAEQIVRNVIEGGRVEVRGVPHHQQVPQIVTGKVSLHSNSFSTWGYVNLELDWNGLLEEGRKLLPSWISALSTKRPRRTQNKSTSSKGKAQRRGPLPGTIDRYNDESLFPEMDRMTHEERMSVHAAALELAYNDKVAGSGTNESRARRLAKHYRQKQNSLPLVPTRSD